MAASMDGGENTSLTLALVTGILRPFKGTWPRV